MNENLGQNENLIEPDADAIELVDLPLVTEGENPPEGVMEVPHDQAILRTISHVTRVQVLERARSWVEEHVMYSQAAYHKNRFGRYRQDCSGYVSMCWALGTSYTTATMLQVARKIGLGDLQGGDALHRAGHIALFIGWADGAHTQPMVYEEYNTGHPCERRRWANNYARSFTPIRAHNVDDAPRPPNGPPPQPGHHVFRTWGTSVRIRKQPNTNSEIVGTLTGPTTIEIRCQVHGEKVTAEGITNDGWSFLPAYNGYISNIYVDHPAYWLPDVPSC